MTGTWVLIPSYQPGDRLIEVVTGIRRAMPYAGVLVVDDGSGPEYRERYDAAARLGASVLHHEANLGKAAALRTGMEWLRLMLPEGVVVCADSDGQHRPADIAAVAATAHEHTALGHAAAGEPRTLVLGTRAFAGEVPLRSRLGNRAATALVAAATGQRITDTQTGLRAFDVALIPWLLSIQGERFAYESRVLLEAGRAGVRIIEAPIETVYLERNASSHFRPVIDSLQVLAPMLLFAASSLVAAAVDLLGALVLSALTGSLALAVVGARIASAAVNFTLNRRAVFDSRGPLGAQVVRYLSLAVVLVGMSYLGTLALTVLGLPLLAAKLLTDSALWLVSYLAQRRLVFAPGIGAPQTQSSTV